MYIRVIQLMLLIFVRLSTKSDTKGTQKLSSQKLRGKALWLKNRKQMTRITFLQWKDAADGFPVDFR